MVWLDVIGTSEAGLAGLAPGLVEKIRRADIVIGGESLLGNVARLSGFRGRAQPWPKPFLDIVPLLEEYRGRGAVVLATGDPLWYGAASTLVRHFDADEMRIAPSVSGFQLAAARMGWPLHDCACLTVHGRPHEKIIRYLAPGAKLLVLAHDRDS